MTSPGGNIHSIHSKLVAAHLPHRRKRGGLAYVEGERSVALALEGVWQPVALFIHPEFSITEQGRQFQTRARERKCIVAETSREALAKLSDCTTPPDAGVVVKPVGVDLAESAHLPGRLVILDGISDPGNAGTLIRAAAAFGFSSILIEGSVRITNEKLLRSTAGICFTAGSVYTAGTGGELAERLRGEGFRVVALAPRKGRPLGDVVAAFRGSNVAIVVGGETSGIDESNWPHAEFAHIPMVGDVESLNAAVCGAIALYEWSRKVPS